MAKEDKKSILTEFKEFISRGNVLDMAVGVIVGGAFTAIVNSLVADIFTPLIGIIIGGIDFASLSLKIPDTVIDGKVIAQGAELTYGNFIQSVITFLLTALCVFILVKAINSFRRKKEEPEPEPEPEAPPAPTTEELLTEIRDLLLAQSRAASSDEQSPAEGKSDK